jgi:hypothetical protein
MLAKLVSVIVNIALDLLTAHIAVEDLYLSVRAT